LTKQNEPDQPITSNSINNQAQVVIQKTEAVQDQTKGAIGRMEGLIAETEVIGGHVLNELDRQGQKMEIIEEDLETIIDDVKTSRQLIKAIQKELQKDKCWRLLVFIVLAIGLILVIWAGADKGFSKSTSNAGGDNMASASDRCQGCNPPAPVAPV